MGPKWIIWYAIVMHWIWGITLLFSRDPLAITTISSLIASGFVTAPHAAIMYLSIAFLALIGMAAPKVVGVLLLIPQQIVLIISAVGAFRAMMTGVFPDGAIRSHSFLVADQIPAVLAAIFHLFAVYLNYFSKED